MKKIFTPPTPTVVSYSGALTLITISRSGGIGGIGG
jgi:hypothetical protein